MAETGKENLPCPRHAGGGRIASKISRHNRGVDKKGKIGILLDSSKISHHNFHMPLKMSKQTTDELLLSIAADYHRLEGRKAKHAILEKIMSLTGYKSSKSIIRKLAAARLPAVGKSRGRPRICPDETVTRLKDLWFLMEQPCGKRMKSMLPEWLPYWEKRQDIPLSDRERQLMLSISAASLDRVLSPFRVKDSMLLPAF